MSLISKNNLGKIVTKGMERPVRKGDFYVSGMVIHVKDRKSEYDCVVFTKKDIEEVYAELISVENFKNLRMN